MREVSYALEFERAKDGDPTVAHGPVSVTVTTLDGSFKPKETTRVEIADGASYESSYSEDLDGIRFWESGTVTFGSGATASTLRFSPLVPGYLVPPADPETGLTPGIAIWSVSAGTGFFEGATGTITSRFGVDLKSNHLVDEHLALILLPEENAE